jgi:hypothetical protein
MNADISARPLSAQNIVARLLCAVPEFKPDPDDVRDGLNYIIFSSLVTFIRELDPKNDWERVQRVFDFIEAAAQSADKLVVDVIRDALWGLAGCSDVELYKAFIGPRTKKLLKQVPIR